MNAAPDPRLTAALRDWLAQAPAARDTAAGALLLLRLTRNRTLYRNILARPARHLPKLERELRKHLRIRLEGLTPGGVARMEKAVVRSADSLLADPPPAPAAPAAGAPAQPAAFRGRRPDHDSLPPAIQALYERGGTLFRQIRQTRETLRAMARATPCDRHELCVQLSRLDKEYRQGWEAYDRYQPQ